MESTNSPKCMKIKHSHTFAYIFHSSISLMLLFGTFVLALLTYIDHHHDKK
ncbi:MULTISPECIES: putative holin-like toxin [Lactobacillus]